MSPPPSSLPSYAAAAWKGIMNRHSLSGHPVLFLVHLFGGLAAMLGGRVMAQATTSGTAGAGIAVAFFGFLGLLLPLYYRDRSEKRAIEQERWKAEQASKQANLQGQLDQHKSEMARQKVESDREKAEVKAKAEAAEEKVHQAIQETNELRRQLSDVPANRARIAATDGKLDAVLEELRLSGFLKPPKPGEGQRSPRTTVLIAEDDPIQARALQTLLTAKGYAASSAVTMEEGFSMLEKGPHLMILDLRIQGKDGLDLLRKVRADGKQTRTVIVTGMADPVELAKAEVLRPEKILKKPVDFEELLEVLTPLDSGRAAETGSGGSDGPRPA